MKCIIVFWILLIGLIISSKPGGKLSTNQTLGLNITTLAYGMAKFLDKSTKEELNVTFFDHFKRFGNISFANCLLTPKN